MKKPAAFAAARRTTFRLAILLGSSATWLSVAPAARAATYTWTGGGSNADWSAVANWNGGVPVSALDTAVVFAGTSNLAPQQNSAGSFLLNALSFDGTAGAFVLGGSGALDFRTSTGGLLPTLTQNSAIVQTINNRLSLSDNLTVGGTGTGTLTLSGALGGAGSLTKTNAGTLTLSGTNTYTGGTTVNTGTLVSLNNGGALGIGGTTAIAGGATLELRNTTSNSLALAATTFTGAGILQKTGTGTYTLGSTGGNVNVSLGQGGLIDVQAGTLRGSSSYQGFYNNNLGGLNIAAGGTFNGTEATVQVDALTGAGTLQGGYYNANTFAQQGSTTIGMAGGSGTFSGIVADNSAQLGTLSLTKKGAGTQVLTGSNTYTGGTTFAGGALNAGSAGALGTSGTLTFSGGTLQYSAANTTDYSARFSTAAGQAYSIDTNGQKVTFASTLTSSGGSLTKLGMGTLTLTGSSSYQNATRVNDGTLALAPGASLTSGTSFVSGAAGASMTQTSSAFTVNGDLNVGSNKSTTGTYTMSGSASTLHVSNLNVGIGGTGSFIQSSGSATIDGTLRMSGLNYDDFGFGTGIYNLQDGTLNSNRIETGPFDPGKFVQDGGVVNITATTNGTIPYFYDGVRLSGASTYALNGGSLNTLLVSGGRFNFNGGTLRPTSSDLPGADSFNYYNFFQGVSTLVQAGGAIIDTAGFNVTVDVSLQHDVALGSTADGGLTKLGAGTLTLTGASNYTGVTNVNGGTLAIASGSLAGGTINVNVGASLTVSGTGSITGNTSELALEGTTAAPALLSIMNNAAVIRGNVIVGYLGVAVATQAGGSLTTSQNIDRSFVVGYIAGSNGTYNLNGGGLSTGDADMGLYGAGTFNQSGGTFTTNGRTLYLGHYNNGSGAYNLSGGALTTERTQVGNASGASKFIQTGGTHTTGTLSLSGATDSSQGTYNLNGGTLAAGTVTSGNDGVRGTSTFNFNGGTLRAGGGSATFFQDLSTANVQAGGARIDSGTFSVTIAQNLQHDVALGSTADGGLTKLGAGTLTLTGTNTFTGPVTINMGTLTVTSEAGLGSGSGGVVTVNGAGRLQFAGDTTLSRTYNLGFTTLTAASGSTLTFGSGALINGGFLSGPTTGALGNGSTLNTVTTQVGSTLRQSDGGAATLNNTTVRGALNQTSGTLAANDVTAATSSQIMVGGTLNASGTELDGRTTVNNGGVLNTSSASLFFGGGARATVNAGGTLAAVDGSTVELNGALLVNNGTQTGTLNVNYGSTAKGTGTFGTVNVGDGGRFGTNAATGGAALNGLSVVHLTGSGGLAETAFIGPQPLTAPGTVNVASLALGSGSVFAFSIQNAQGMAGSGYDTAHASGTLTLAAGTAAGSQITISIASLNSGGTAGPALNFDPAKSYAFVLVSADGGIVGYNPAEFTVDTSGFQNGINGGSFSVGQSGNNLILNYNVVPEPATWRLLGFGGVFLLGLILHQRRSHAF